MSVVLGSNGYYVSVTIGFDKCYGECDLLGSDGYSSMILDSEDCFGNVTH